MSSRLCRLLAMAVVALVAAFSVPTRGLTQTQTGLEVTFIGNAAMLLTDGTRSLISDFPYESGAFGYMTYDRTTVRPTGHVTLLITHAHRDHFVPSLLIDPTWSVIAPDGMTPALPASRRPAADALAKAGIEVAPAVTAHGPITHQSYRVDWNGVTAYFTGDTDDLTALLAQRDLDVAFVTPWLWRAANTQGATIRAKQIVIYHHQANEAVPGCTGTCRVPVQGAWWRI